MAFFSVFRDQDGPIELKITFDSRDEANKLYYELIEAKTEWSAEAKDFFTALQSARQRPSLH